MNVTGETNLAEGEVQSAKRKVVVVSSNTACLKQRSKCLCCCRTSNSSNCSSCCLPYQKLKPISNSNQIKCTDYAPLAAPEDDSDEMAEYAQIKDIYPSHQQHQGPPQPPLPPSIPPPLATAGKKINPLYKMPSHELISSPLTPSKSRPPPQQHQTFHHRHRGDFKEQSNCLFFIFYILFLYFYTVFSTFFFGF